MAVHVYVVDVWLPGKAQRPTGTRVFDRQQQAAEFAREKRRLGFEAVVWEM